MTRIRMQLVVILGLLVASTTAADAADIRRAAPSDAHLAVYIQNNPERDAHWSHWQGVFQSIQEEQIGQRLMKVATTRMAEDDVANAEAILAQLRAAVSSTSLEAIADAEEVMYAQVLEMPTSQHLLVLRMPEDQAGGLADAVEGLFRLIESWSDGKAAVVEAQVGGVEVVTLQTPERTTVRPAVARLDDLVLISTKEQLLLDGLDRLTSSDGASKFDDPRFQEALMHLPPGEDAIVLFDGRALSERIGEMLRFVRASEGDKPNVARTLDAVETALIELDIFDYEVTVEYTEGFQQRTAALGKFTADAKEKMLYQAIAQGEPLENWQQWIPADATAYSLHTGVRLSVVYQWAEQYMREQFPESHDALNRWESLQKEIDFNLNDDLLDAFPGGCVSVALALEGEDGTEKSHQVVALRTTDGEQVLDLIHRGIDALNHFPAVNTQGLRITECPELEGFWELQANVFPMFNVRPVFGLEGGWLVLSDSPRAIQHVAAVRAGEAESIVDSKPWQRLDMDVSGKVYAVKYTDVEAAVEGAAQMVEQIGAFAPIAVGMIGAQSDPEVAAAINEVLAVLPSISKVIRQLDFLQDSLSVTRPGPLENSYRTDWVLQLEPVE